MAQADKIIEKIKAKPAPNNIKWDELVVALKHLGYKEITNSGSRRKFFNAEKNNMISLHRPHPGNEVKTCYIKDVRETLEEIGLIEARK
jgi:predicted RNA binding protein YcfA (HicA-like mRNA interferase family)